MRRGMGLVIIGVVVVIYTAVFAALVARAHAECMSLRQAKRENPGVYLSWRGHHCWFAPAKRHESSRPLQRAKQDTVSIPSSGGSSPSTAATPPAASLPVSPMVDQVLTENSLIIHGVERLPLTERINDTTKQIDSVAVTWHDPVRLKRLDRERIIRALGVILFVSVVLFIIAKIAGSTLVRLQRLT
jgi:hypothetical protein